MSRSKLLDAVAGGDVARVAAMLHPDITLTTALNPAQGTTPLYRAAVAGNHEIVRLLLEYGAEPDRPSGGEDEGLPLCAAARRDHARTVQALLDGGADPDAREHGGWTALLWASANGHLESADVLLDAAADPDGANDDGDTPLTLAARFGAYGIVRSLLEHGADPSLPGSGGRSALEIARWWASADLESALREEIAAHLGEEHAEGDHTLVTSGCAGPDGTRLISVEARRPDGGRVAISRQCGHVAIATHLEIAVGVRPPVAELLERVRPYREIDAEDVTWWSAVHALRRRHDDETFEAVTRLCDGADPVEREFGADVLAEFGQDLGHDPYHDRALAILRDMARQESEPRVVESVLHALGHRADERALPEVLDIVELPGRTPTVNDAVALAAVLPPDDEAGIAALIRLSESADPEVRDWATMGIAGLAADTRPIREALADRLADTDLTTVAEAALGLAGRGDRRAIEGIHRVLCEGHGTGWSGERTDDQEGDRDDDWDYARDLVLEAAAELGLEISGAGIDGAAVT
ncbi:ankyrin repeat domain-containing protein [Sphaerimonospora sp. CA-214678]|uniref:ankyrin repeat domain-containing protein n=1 Tax=Sphaerimonospora sp. CA-214678 TaxID=3240029 RepID=UPI003D8F64BD